MSNMLLGKTREIVPKNEEAGPKQKGRAKSHPAVDVTGDKSKV